jgi:hypothetical protein
MNKLIILVLGVLFIGTACYAQEKPVVVKHEASPVIKAKTITGKVEAITLADPAKATKTELVVVDENGVKATFVLGATTIIHDNITAVMGADKLAKDEKVQVKYLVSAAGANEAISVKVLK